MMSRRKTTFALTLTLGLSTAATAQEKSIVIASTTSTQDSGLFEYLLPIFRTKTGIAVKVIAQGTGQALDTGSQGDADVVLVHPKFAGLRFLAQRTRRETISGDVINARSRLMTAI